MSTTCAAFTTLCRALEFARRRSGLGTVVLVAGVLFGGAGADAKGAWTAPVRLDARGSSPVVAVDERGDAVAVWSECSPGCAERSLVSDYLAAGATTWAGPESITTGGYFGTVGTDGAGNAVALWSGPAGIGSAIRAASSGTWQSSTVSSASASGFDEMRLAVDPAGDAVAVWEREFLIEAAVRSAKTGAWLAPVVISNATEHSSEATSRSTRTVTSWYRMEGLRNLKPLHASRLTASHALSSSGTRRASKRHRDKPVGRGSSRSRCRLAEARPSLGSRSTPTVTPLRSGASRAAPTSSRVISRPLAAGPLAPVPLVSSAFADSGGSYGGLQLALDGSGEATAAWSGRAGVELSYSYAPRVSGGGRPSYPAQRPARPGAKLAVGARGAAVSPRGRANQILPTIRCMSELRSPVRAPGRHGNNRAISRPPRRMAASGCDGAGRKSDRRVGTAGAVRRGRPSARDIQQHLPAGSRWSSRCGAAGRMRARACPAALARTHDPCALSHRATEDEATVSLRPRHDIDLHALVYRSGSRHRYQPRGPGTRARQELAAEQGPPTHARQTVHSPDRRRGPCFAAASPRERTALRSADRSAAGRSGRDIPRARSRAQRKRQLAANRAPLPCRTLISPPYPGAGTQA